eukprot:gnl/MRDRNA2_/MRDRNA2_117059_c0_seq1.p1 gnl/MRDRNA2_/MRDRNA2_117059_c0~~gnl/MRDRNA2_/MRDRNA2_117059_c0_seq1.p1  ORF type:complete len:381 (+),score=99.29 gnl/MRDRNA2_/MRDRNA2_117059_c0_seq1:42-1184(+)
MAAWHCLAALALLGRAGSFFLQVASSTGLDAKEDRLADEFWIAQLNSLKHEVVELQKVAEGRIAALQVSQGPRSNKTLVSRDFVRNKTSGTVTEAYASNKSTLQNILASPAVSAATGDAMLSPMMGMLKSYVKDQKARVGELNKMEEADKKKFAERKAEHERRLKALEERHAHGMNNKTYEKFLWQENHNFKRVAIAARDRHKRSFHNTLKMIHGMMAKEKTMIDAYSGAMSAKPTSNKQKKTLAKLGVEEPEVVLVQNRAVVVAFCSNALREIQEELRRLVVAEAEIEGLTPVKVNAVIDAPVSLHGSSANATVNGSANRTATEMCFSTITKACEACYNKDSSQPCYYHQRTTEFCAGNSDLMGGSLCSISAANSHKWS